MEWTVRNWYLCRWMARQSDRLSLSDCDPLSPYHRMATAKRMTRKRLVHLLMASGIQKREADQKTREIKASQYSYLEWWRLHDLTNIARIHHRHLGAKVDKALPMLEAFFEASEPSAETLTQREVYADLYEEYWTDKGFMEQHPEIKDFLSAMHIWSKLLMAVPSYNAQDDEVGEKWREVDLAARAMYWFMHAHVIYGEPLEKEREEDERLHLLLRGVRRCGHRPDPWSGDRRHDGEGQTRKEGCEMIIQIPNQRAVIEHYGVDAQIPIYMEELAELIQAISKIHRQETPERRDNLVEEIGDSLICMHQLMEIYGIKNWEIQKIVKQKLERQEARMHGDV